MIKKVIRTLSLAALVTIIGVAGCGPVQTIDTEAEVSGTPDVLIDHEAAMEAFMGGETPQPVGSDAGETPVPQGDEVEETAEATPQANRTEPEETVQPTTSVGAEDVPQADDRSEDESAPRVGDLEVLYEGIQRPHGIGVVGDVLYVSSEVDRGLYRITDGALELLAKLNFPHDMIAMRDGSLITPVFLEDRVVRIDEDGTLTELAGGLSGPNGIAEDGDGSFYVSNYFAGTVVLIGNAAPPQTIATRLNGPAGLAYNKDSNTLYVAEYLGNQIAVIRGDERDRIALSGLINVESLFVSSDGKVLATAELDRRGVVVEVLGDGGYEVLVSTDLPGPLVGHFTDDGYVYLVSPNDREGRILKALVTQP